MDIQKLTELRMEGHTIKSIAMYFECSESKIKKHIKTHNLEKSSSKPVNGLQCDNCNNPLKGSQKRFCSPNCKQLNFLEVNGKNSIYQYQKEKGYERKKHLIKLKGGSCELCGYNKCNRALTFHHRDPDLKKFTLDIRNLSCTSNKLIMEEFSKCDLLCFNCHMEIHDSLVGVKGLEPLTVLDGVDGL